MKNQRTGGYTLIELMVSIGLFAIIMTLVAGAYLMIINLSRNAQAISTAVDSVSFSLEDMTREIRTGTAYGCATSGTTAIAGTDCVPPAAPSGGTAFILTDQSGNTVDFSLQPVSGSGSCPSASGNCGIFESVNGGTPSAITDPSVNIQSLTFYAAGTEPYSVGANTTPANVVIIVAGTVSTGKTTLPFNVETAATMRGVDL